MNKLLVSLVLVLIRLDCKAQVGATFYQSPSFSSVGVMYEFVDRIRLELHFDSDGLNL